MEEKPSKQIIKFSGADADPTFAVHSRNVEVESEEGSSTNGISRIKANNIVDYSWEERFFSGQMLAVHRSGKYVAYGLKGRSKLQCTIRIVNRDTDIRALLKDVEGLIEDLSFAQTLDVVLLACIDNTGLLLVYHITDSTDEILTTLILQVLPDDSIKKWIPYRVFWCSCIPEEEYDEEDDVSKLLAVTRYNKIELWNIGTISPNLQPTKGPIRSGDTKEGYLVIEAHDDLITEAVFSPDGTAIATASLDGTCKFYQVYMPTGEAESRCLHQWSPHHGRPVTTLFFLDDLRKYNPDVPFWKYAITGTDDNSELSLWSCETWQRLQHIKIKNTSPVETKFKIGIDVSASVIVMNDMANRILYILELNKGEIQNSIPYVSTVTELRLQFAILSFGIVDAYIGSAPPDMSPTHFQSSNHIIDEKVDRAVMLRMYIIQPKSLQFCDIAYQTKKSTIPVPSPLPNEEYANGECGFDNGTCSTSTSEEEIKADSSLDNGVEPPANNQVVDCVPLTPPPLPLNLMTPEAFSTSSNSVTAVDSSMDLRPDNVDIACGLVDEAMESATESLAAMPVPTEPIVSVSSVLDCSVPIKSGGSSPSREVEEILGMKKAFPEESEEKKQPVVEQLANPPSYKLQHASSQTWVVSQENKSVGPVFSIADVQDLKEDIKKLCRTLDKQCRKIQELENQLKMSKQTEKADRSMEIFTKKVLDRLQAQQEKTDRLHAVTMQSINSHREETTSHICQLVEQTLCSHLPAIIQSQLMNLINPGLNDVKDIIQEEVSSKLTATDVLLQDNISRMFKNKGLMESLTAGLTAAGKEGVSQVCRDALMQALPRIEKACSSMMSDMADTFSNGTAQHVTEVESQLKRLTEHWHVQVNDLHTQLLQQANTQTIQIIEKSFGELEDRLYKKLSKTLAKAVNSGVTSRVMTPAVGSSSQADIMELVHQGHLSEAFQQALSAAELPLVLGLCEKVPTSQIFTPRGCVLPQPVLLSLIQQLSSDLSSYSETKHRYLEEAVMNLDRCNPVTREHIPKVVSHLNRQLSNFISTNAMSPFIKRVKMLHMATLSLLN